MFVPEVEHFPKQNFWHFYKTYLPILLAAKAEVEPATAAAEAEEKKSPSRTQRKSVAYIAAHASRVGKKQQQQQRWQCNLATSQ